MSNLEKRSTKILTPDAAAGVAEGNERKRNPKQPVFEFFAVPTKKTGLLKFIGVRLNLLIYGKFKPISWL